MQSTRPRIVARRSHSRFLLEHFIFWISARAEGVRWASGDDSAIPFDDPELEKIGCGVPWVLGFLRFAVCGWESILVSILSILILNIVSKFSSFCTFSNSFYPSKRQRRVRERVWFSKFLGVKTLKILVIFGPTHVLDQIPKILTFWESFGSTPS